MREKRDSKQNQRASLDDYVLIHKSGKQKEADLKNRWLRVVQDLGVIKRTELREKLNLTIKEYERFAPWIQEEFEEFVEYNRVSKRWMWIKKEETEKVEEVSNA